MKKTKSKLKYQEGTNGNVKLFVEREHATDIELKGLTNPSSYKNLDGEECEYFKAGKQLIVWVKKMGKNPFYDSRKPADTPTYNRPEGAVLVTKPVEQPTSRRPQNIREERSSNMPDSFSIRNARVPLDVRDIRRLEADNFYLKLFKFARFDSRDEKFKFFAGRRSGNFEIKSNNYGGIFEFDKITETQKDTAKKLYGEEGSGFVTKSFKPDWRFVVGLGTDSIYETGITLHHIYGFPYIPASAIKGIIRNYIINRDFDLTNKEREENNESQWSAIKEKKALSNNTFKKIFGDTSNKGKIIFLDAMPKTSPKLKVDIMNPHYPDWYGSGKAPTDTQSPRPIYFLTVEETAYQFILASKEKDNQLLEIAQSWLENALKEKGIGAKTAVGYGYMTE